MPHESLPRTSSISRIISTARAVAAGFTRVGEVIATPEFIITFQPSTLRQLDFDHADDDFKLSRFGVTITITGVRSVAPQRPIADLRT